MSHKEMDYTKKIRYAEEWLKKAKTEFEQGASLQAGSHVILAIAEMENLKRALFEENSLPETNSSGVSIKRLDYRPFAAAALIFIAFAIFSYTVHFMNNETSRYPVVASSSDVDNIEREFPESKLMEFLSVPFEETNQVMASLGNPVENVDETTESIEASDKNVMSSTATSAKPASAKGNENQVKRPEKTPQPVMASAEKPISVESVRDTSVGKSDLKLEEIQLETIIAARESLSSD